MREDQERPDRNLEEVGQELKDGLEHGGTLPEGLRNELIALLQNPQAAPQKPAHVLERTREVSRDALLLALDGFIRPGSPGRSTSLLRELGVEENNSAAVKIILERISEQLQRTDDLRILERMVSFLSEMVSEGFNYFKRQDMKVLRKLILKKLMEYRGPDSWAFGRLFETVADYDMADFSMQPGVGGARIAYMRQKLAETKV
jgi:hypothetical protein